MSSPSRVLPVGAPAIADPTTSRRPHHLYTVFQGWARVRGVGSTARGSAE